MDAALVDGPYMRAQRSGAKAEGPRLPAHGPVPGSLAAALVPGGSAMGPVPGRVLDPGSGTERWGKLRPARRMAAGRYEAFIHSRPHLPNAPRRLGPERRRPRGSSSRRSHVRRHRSILDRSVARPNPASDKDAGNAKTRPSAGPCASGARTWVRRGSLKPRAVPRSGSAFAHSASTAAASMVTEPPAFSTAATADLVA